jgi:hypothetical protein
LGAEFVTETSAAAMATGFFDLMTPIMLAGGWRSQPDNEPYAHKIIVVTVI